MTNNLVELDAHRDKNSQHAIAVRQQLITIRAEQIALRQWQEEFERFLADVPANTLQEVAARARALMQLIAALPEAQNPSFKPFIDDLQDAISALCDHERKNR